MGENGNITVISSKGIIAFPASKIEIAQKTGMWDKSLSDAELAKRMKDEEFFNFISEKTNFNPDKILSVNTNFKETSEERLDMSHIAFHGYCTITNNTDKTILPSDYKINFKDYDISIDGQRAKRYSEPGKEIEPKSTIKIEGSILYSSHRSEEDHHLEGVTILLSPEEIQKKFVSFSGNEYQEYLNSKE